MTFDDPRIEWVAMKTPSLKKPNDLHQQIYVALISATAADGKFDLGELDGAERVVKIAEHLKGVSEILATKFGTVEKSESND